MTAAQREAYERGVADMAAVLMAQYRQQSHAVDLITALAMGLMHGTLGPGPEYEAAKAARAARL